MIIFVPDKGKFKEFQKKINNELFMTVKQRMELANVDLTLPKFEFNNSYKLRDIFLEMGMVQAFTEWDSNFYGMSPEPVHINEIVHATYISVAEEGTVAAAATHIREAPPGGSPQYVNLVIDRPFVFVIYGWPGPMLFIGQVINPVE